MRVVPCAQWNDWGVEDLDANIQALKDAGVKVSAVLGFNEPNHEEQSDMSPRFPAASAHRTPIPQNLTATLSSTPGPSDAHADLSLP